MTRRRFPRGAWASRLMFCDECYEQVIDVSPQFGCVKVVRFGGHYGRECYCEVSVAILTGEARELADALIAGLEGR